VLADFVEEGRFWRGGGVGLSGTAPLLRPLLA
jgi:hypothetical protein